MLNVEPMFTLLGLVSLTKDAGGRSQLIFQARVETLYRCRTWILSVRRSCL